MSIVGQPIRFNPTKFLSLQGMLAIFDIKRDDYSREFPFDRNIHLWNGWRRTAGIKDDHLKQAFGQHYEAALKFIELVATPCIVDLIPCEFHFKDHPSNKNGPIKGKVWLRCQSKVTFPLSTGNPLDDVMHRPAEFWEIHKDFVPILFYNSDVTNEYSVCANDFVLVHKQRLAVPLEYQGGGIAGGDDESLGGIVGIQTNAAPKTMKTYQFHLVSFEKALDARKLEDFDYWGTDPGGMHSFHYHVCRCPADALDLLYNFEDSIAVQSALVTKHLKFAQVWQLRPAVWANLEGEPQPVSALANVMTVAEEQLDTAWECNMYWQRRAKAAETLLKAVCDDNFDSSHARKVMLDAHTGAYITGKELVGTRFEDSPLPTGLAAPLCKEVEDALRNILEACPGGQKVAECIAQYGSGAMGKKRKRPDSAPPTL